MGTSLKARKCSLFNALVDMLNNQRTSVTDSYCKEFRECGFFFLSLSLVIVGLVG